ncbi:uncharacterized protein [Eurosta solidaginis]|uniref:uncharacterized protein n=1 Tax=Eurosta solidaginis TaxID=178769 RepID=UPI003530D7DC
MSRLAIKTEKLDVEQEEIGIESRTAVAEEGGFGRQQEHRKGATALTSMSNLVGAGKKQFEVGRNITTRQLQQNSPQYTAALKGNSGGKGAGGGGDTNSGQINSNQHEINSTSKAALPKSRCGEVFVSNNARQWTFICTYCNKSTRDIGEFICHIKIKHLGGFTDDPDETDDGDCDGYQPTNFYEQDQDYMDCSNYLDVNVHTEAEDYNLNGHEQPATYRDHQPQRHAKVAAVPGATRPCGASKKEVNKPKRLNSVDVDETNDDETLRTLGGGSSGFDNTSNQKESAAQWRADPANFQSYSSNKYDYNASTPEVKLKNKIENGSSTADFDASDYAFGKEDFDTGGVGGPYEIDDDDDYDNQLLIAPNDSMDASILGSALADYSGGGLGVDGMKAKRRQIRGTAYCALCNKTFQYYSLYRNHMIKHSNETPFKCPICKKGFKSKQAIRYHMNTHQKEKQHKCTICSASYGTENHFIAHIMTHENATTFPCMVCGQVMSSSKERDIHMAEHKEERPFRCDFCFKLFRLRHHLSNHLKMHRKYRCDYCKEIFTSAIYLRKPYACPGCENTPAARKDAAANSNNAKRKEGSKNINPLEIFEAVIPGQEPQPGDDYAQMVTDSEGEVENEEDDEEGEVVDDDDNDDENAGDDDDSNSNEQADEDIDENSSGVMKRKHNNDNDDDDDDDDDEDENEEEGYANAAGGKPQLLADTKRYKCKYCPSNYTHPSGLSYHMKHKHLK